MTVAVREINLELDDGASAFVTEFISNIATVAGYRDDRLATIYGVKVQLLAALAGGTSASNDAWRSLYRSVSAVVDAAAGETNTRALAYLREFLRDNADLSAATPS
jgi:hypothetical protein